ncbi:MAG: hypothetical protein ABWY54_08745, partial [Glaciihabitans sp.]
MTNFVSRIRRPRSTQALSVSAVVLDGYPPLLKQIPLVILFAVAVVICVVAPSLAITSVPALVAAVVLLVGVTGFAAILPRLDSSGQLVFIVPTIDFLVVGILRFATGESTSIFASLAILPAVWIAASPGTRPVVYAFLGVFGGLLVPFLLGSTLEDNPNEIARSLFSACAFTLAAAAVNDLARLARSHIITIQARDQAT